MTVLIKIKDKEKLFDKIRNFTYEKVSACEIKKQTYYIVSPILAKAMKKVGIKFDTYSSNKKIRPSKKPLKGITLTKGEAIPIIYQEHMRQYMRLLHDIKTLDSL